MLIVLIIISVLLVTSVLFNIGAKWVFDTFEEDHSKDFNKINDLTSELNLTKDVIWNLRVDKERLTKENKELKEEVFVAHQVGLMDQKVGIECSLLKQNKATFGVYTKQEPKTNKCKHEQGLIKFKTPNGTMLDFCGVCCYTKVKDSDPVVYPPVF